MSARVNVFILVLACGMLVWAMALRWTHPLHRDDVQPRDLGYRINVNKADAPTLALLPGIGPKLGQYIIVHRQLIAPFTKPEDLDAVSRIGPLTVQSIRPYIRFD